MMSGALLLSWHILYILFYILYILYLETLYISKILITMPLFLRFAKCINFSLEHNDNNNNNTNSLF